MKSILIVEDGIELLHYIYLNVLIMKGVFNVKRKYLNLTALILCATLLGGCDRTSVHASDNEKGPDAPGEKTTVILVELLAFRFDDYENMTISEYRTKVKEIISKNEVEYLKMIEQINTDSTIQELRFTDTDAYFVANILLPVISEKWETWRLGNFYQSGDALIEYNIHYTIFDAENVTMGERNQAISLIVSEIQTVLDNRETDQPPDADDFEDELNTRLKKLVSYLTTSSFRVDADFVYRPENNVSSIQLEKTAAEERGDAGTKEDYQLLLSLRDEGYEDISVSDFLDNYCQIAQNSDFRDAYTRVIGDISNNDIQVILTDEEQSFLITTLKAVSQEFIAKYQDGNDLPMMRYRIEEHDNPNFEFFIDYGVEYTILNETELTVGERDTILTFIKADMQDFISSKSVDELVDGKETIDDQCKYLEQLYSNNKINVKISVFSYQAHDRSEDIQVLQ